MEWYDTPPRGGDKDPKEEAVHNHLAVVSLCFGSIAGDGGAAGGSPSRGWLTVYIRADGRCQPEW